MNTDATTKMNFMLEILTQGIAMVHLDPRKPGVRVPERFIDDSVLRLNFAYGFNLPGFVVDEEGVAAVLNFNKERFSCTIPWSAVFAITSPEGLHPGRVWSASVPPELVAQWLAEKRRQTLVTDENNRTDTEKPDDSPGMANSQTKTRRSAPQKPTLRVLSPASTDETTSETPPPDEPPPTEPTTPPNQPRLRPKLRIV